MPTPTYCIKPEYEHRTVNATLEQTPGDYWTATRLLLSHYAQYAVYQKAAAWMRQHQLQSVLDVGCGPGHKLVEHLEPIADRVVGIDQPSCIAKAHALFPDTRVQFTSADFEQPGHLDLEPCDLVMSVDVIEHMLDPDRLLAFIRSHCHEKSYVLISTPERDIRRGKNNLKSPKSEHVREWNIAEFGAYLTGEGFKVVEHVRLPAFKVGTSSYMLKERWRLLRKGISHRYTQAAICRLG